MKRALLIGAVAAIASLGGSATATGGGTISAQVESIATVTGSNTVVFEFNLYNCPPGGEIVVEFEARQPNRPDSGAAGGGGYGLSNGDAVQHLTAELNSSSFLAGNRWTGSGMVTCGAAIIPVEGSGTTKSVNGL